MAEADQKIRDAIREHLMTKTEEGVVLRGDFYATTSKEVGEKDIADMHLKIASERREQKN